MSLRRLRPSGGGLTAAQKSADGVVGPDVGEAREALQGRKAEQQIGRAETKTEGPNDREWQVGLATHEWKAAEFPVLAGLGIEQSG